MTDNTQPARWYMVDKDGMATLCTDREDAEQEAKDANMSWPHTAPHRAVQLVEVGTAAAELHRQHARIVELEAQLEAIGAGGVSGPLIGQAQAMPDLSVLTERGATAWAGVDAQGLRDNFTTADMATAEARGFRDGVASVAANAGSELVAQPGDAEAILSKICDLFFIGKLARNESTILTNIRNVIDHAGLLHAVERDLFPQPELPEDDDPYAAVDEGLPAPNSWAAKDEADYVAQFRAALAARGFNAQGLRDGVASAGSEPVAWVDERALSWLANSRSISATITTKLEKGKSFERPMPLYTHPSPPPTSSADSRKGE